MEKPTTRQGNRLPGESAALTWTEPKSPTQDRSIFILGISEEDRRRGNYPPILDTQEGHAAVNCGCEKWVRRQHEGGPITQIVLIKGCAFRLPRGRRTPGELLLYKLMTTRIDKRIQPPRWYRGPKTQARVYCDYSSFMDAYIRDAEWFRVAGYERVTLNI